MVRLSRTLCVKSCDFIMRAVGSHWLIEKKLKGLFAYLQRNSMTWFKLKDSFCIFIFSRPERKMLVV